MSLSLAVADQGVDGRGAPAALDRSRRRSSFFVRRQQPRSSRSAALFDMHRAPVVEEAGEGIPSAEQ